jgi:hypothetical protein
MTGLLIPKGTSFAEFLERRHLTTTTVLFPPSHRPNWPQPGTPKSPPIPRALRSLAVTTHRRPAPRRSPTSCASRPPGVAQRWNCDAQRQNHRHRRAQLRRSLRDSANNCASLAQAQRASPASRSACAQIPSAPKAPAQSPNAPKAPAQSPQRLQSPGPEPPAPQKPRPRAPAPPKPRPRAPSATKAPAQSPSAPKAPAQSPQSPQSPKTAWRPPRTPQDPPQRLL